MWVGIPARMAESVPLKTIRSEYTLNLIASKPNSSITSWECFFMSTDCESKINKIVDEVLNERIGNEYVLFLATINSSGLTNDLYFELENLFIEQTRKSVIYAYEKGYNASK